jgi:hypothetical protein
MFMAVIARFTYENKPGRMQDFITKLARARSPEFNSPVMPKSVRLFQNTVPGPEARYAILLIEYEDMAAYGARTAFEQSNEKWRELFDATPNSPEQLMRVELLTEYVR